mmetsp:Transcript_22715/g.50512  ORF Transcript_22715/g.50512 Transcript_22715/m.50512 type:complete len:253 (-) Transcript_22715:556-1314(-)
MSQRCGTTVNTGATTSTTTSLPFAGAFSFSLPFTTAAPPLFSAACSGVSTSNLTRMSIFVGFEILTLSTTPRPEDPQLTGPKASMRSISAKTTLPTANFSNFPIESPVESAREATISCSSNMLYTSSVTMPGTQDSPVTSKVRTMVVRASLGSDPDRHSRTRSLTVSQPLGSKRMSMPTDCPGSTDPTLGVMVNAPTTKGSSGTAAGASSSGSTTSGLSVDVTTTVSLPFALGGGAFFPFSDAIPPPPQRVI